MNKMFKRAVSFMMVGMLGVCSVSAYTAPVSTVQPTVSVNASLHNVKTGERIELPVEMDKSSMRTYAIDDNTNEMTVDAEVKLAELLPKSRASDTVEDTDKSASVKGTLKITYSYKPGGKYYVRLDRVSGSFTSSVDRLELYDTTVSPGQSGIGVSDGDLVGTEVDPVFSLDTGFTDYVAVSDSTAVLGAYASTMIHYRNYTDWEFEIENYLLR